MSRSRRRDRRLHLRGQHNGGELPIAKALKSLYVQQDEEWNMAAMAPALPLEGFSAYEEIRGPALALEDAPGISGEETHAEFSTDPSQLSLAALAAAEAEVVDRVPPDDEMIEAEAPAMVDEKPDAAPPAPTAAAEPSPSAVPRFELVEESRSVPQPDLFKPESEAEADLAAVAELEALTEAASADARLSDVAAELIARAIEDTTRGTGELPAEPAPEPTPPPEPPPPDPIELLFDDAQAAAAAGRSDDARAIYRQVLAQRPLHVRARNNLALLLDAAGDHAAALAELDRALDIEPENVTLLVNRGGLLGQLGRFAAAERDLKRVLRVEPSHAEALFNLGVVMTKKGLWGEAVPALRRAIELDPARAQAHFYLGEALNHVDDLGGALLAYQRATELEPSHSRALYGLGIVMDRLGRPDDAALMYRRSREVAGRR